MFKILQVLPADAPKNAINTMPAHGIPARFPAARTRARPTLPPPRDPRTRTRTLPRGDMLGPVSPVD